MSRAMVAAIYADAERIAEIREEIEREGGSFWSAISDGSEWAYQQQQLERMRWESDQAAVAEYESWFLQKTIAEQDAEGVAAQ